MSLASETRRWTGPSRVLTDLVAPVRCVGCGRPRQSVCLNCLSGADPCPQRRVVVDERGPLEIWAGARYVGVVQAVVLSFKRHGSRNFGRVLTSWGARALAVWSCTDDIAGRSRVVPLHSGRATREHAGIDVSSYLARASCRELARRGLAVSFVDLLRPSNPTATSQKTLTLAERFGNVRGSIQVRRRRLPPGDCLLFDDVVTTGASLLEARRVLMLAGVRVRGAACVAVVPSRDSAGDRASDAADDRASDAVSDPTRGPTRDPVRRARCPPER